MKLCWYKNRFPPFEKKYYCLYYIFAAYIFLDGLLLNLEYLYVSQNDSDQIKKTPKHLFTLIFNCLLLNLFFSKIII